MSSPSPSFYAVGQPTAPPAPPRRVDVTTRWVAIAALATGIAGLTLGGVAISRPPATPAVASPAAPATPSLSPAAERELCTGWHEAAKAIVAARQPFITLTAPGEVWAWTDSTVQAALSQAQAGVAVQALTVRDAVATAGAEETDLGRLILTSVRISVEIVALDGQHASDSVVNARAHAATEVNRDVKAHCGIG